MWWERLRQQIRCRYMAEIVHVRLPTDRETKQPLRHAPFMVYCPADPWRSDFYVDEPNVIAQLADDEFEARFEAEWVDEEWRFGRRIVDG
jgi:hypothetical protein